MLGNSIYSKSNDAKEGRCAYFDILKIFAIFFVIFNHTNKHGFMLFLEYPNSSFMFWIAMFLSVFCKFAVPTFFAISGALLIKNFSEPIGVLYKKRIIPKFVILLLFSVLYYCLYSNYPFSNWGNVVDFFGRFWSGQINIILWFLYAYIGFLIALPILRKLVNGLEKKVFHYIFLIDFTICSGGKWNVFISFYVNDLFEVKSFRWSK